MLEYLTIQDPIDFSREEYSMLYEVHHDTDDRDKAGAASLQDPQASLQQAGWQNDVAGGANARNSAENNVQGNVTGSALNQGPVSGGIESKLTDKRGSADMNRKLSMFNQVRAFSCFVCIYVYIDKRSSAS